MKDSGIECNEFYRKSFDNHFMAIIVLLGAEGSASLRRCAFSREFRAKTRVLGYIGDGRMSESAMWYLEHDEKWGGLLSVKGVDRLHRTRWPPTTSRRLQREFPKVN